MSLIIELPARMVICFVCIYNLYIIPGINMYSRTFSVIVIILWMLVPAAEIIKKTLVGEDMEEFKR